MGCRQRAAKADLLRVVAADGPAGPRAVPDPGARLPGRGASLHLDPACLALAVKRRAFPRALRTGGPLDLTAVEEHVEQHHQHGQHGQHGQHVTHPPRAGRDGE